MCITARTSRTCHDPCRDRYLVVSFEFGGGENVPGIPGDRQEARVTAVTSKKDFVVLGLLVSDVQWIRFVQINEPTTPPLTIFRSYLKKAKPLSVEYESSAI